MHFTGKIFALDSDIVKTKTMFSSHGGFLSYVIHQHRKINQTQLTFYDETKKMASEPQKGAITTRWAILGMISEMGF